MTLYKRQINEKGFLELIGWESDDEYDFSKDPESNLFGEENRHSINFELADADIKHANKLIMSGAIKVRKCRCCHKYFLLQRNDIIVCNESHRQFPSLCFSCKNKDQTKAKIRTDVPIIRERYELQFIEG